MTIKAEIVADSVNELGNRITTFVLIYPRFIHSEIMTHRAFSRNAASSRAIPMKTFVDRILEDTASPIRFSKNKKGMQASEYLTQEGEAQSKIIWKKARDHMIDCARQLADIGVHKQHCNRLLEPFIHMKMIVTATDFDNFFALRDHSDAQPELAELARCMKKELNASGPVLRIEHHDMHLPFISDDERQSGDLGDNKFLSSMIVKSVARCARVSYDKVEGGTSDIQNDLRIFLQLGQSSPIHASPFEHIAIPEDEFGFRCRNFVGWTQFRHMVEEAPETIEIIKTNLTEG
jgi:thymidylate synthase ThyX